MTRTLGRQDSLFIPLGNAPLASPPGDACWECLVPHPEDMNTNVLHIVAPIWGLICESLMCDGDPNRSFVDEATMLCDQSGCATSTRTAIRSLRTLRVCACNARASEPTLADALGELGARTATSALMERAARSVRTLVTPSDSSSKGTSWRRSIRNSAPAKSWATNSICAE